MVTLYAAADRVHSMAPSEPSDTPPAPVRVELAPGRIYFTAIDAEVTVVLGFGVAVCLWDPQAQVGGVNHFLLPSGSPPSPSFGDAAMDELIAAVLDLGAHRARLLAKVFGGACELDVFRDESASVGLRNVEMAHERLRGAGIPVVSQDVGGNRHRKVTFRIRTGASWVRDIDQSLP